MLMALPLNSRTSAVAMAEVTLALLHDHIYLYGATLSVLYIILPGNSNL